MVPDAGLLQVAEWRRCGCFRRCVAFLFPHSGRKGMHHLNTQLLHDFVASAAPLLTEDGRMEVTPRSLFPRTRAL